MGSYRLIHELESVNSFIMLHDSYKFIRIDSRDQKYQILFVIFEHRKWEIYSGSEWKTCESQLI